MGKLEFIHDTRSTAIVPRSQAMLMFWKISRILPCFAIAIITIGQLTPMTFAQPTPSPAPTSAPFDKLQLPVPITTLLNNSNLPENTRTKWIYLDGRRIFQIAALQDNLSERVQQVQTNLDRIAAEYYQDDRQEPSIEIKTSNRLPTIDINGQRLLTVTNLDAQVRSLDPDTLATQLQTNLKEDLTHAKQERQKPLLVKASQISVGILAATTIISWGLSYQRYRLRRKFQTTLKQSSDSPTNQSQNDYKQAIQTQQQILRISQIAAWCLAIYGIFEQFPYTRPISRWVFYQATLPIHLIIISIVTYFAIRLSYGLIDRLQSDHRLRKLLTPIDPQRLDLRITTIALVTKGMTALGLICLGIIVVLIILGVDVFTLITGIGLVGVAISLASQSLIKDAMNGFLIILEDQFGVGDMIKINDIAGIVENMTLRITQIRNAEGQLITIPNSEIKMIANLSSEWARVDLNIPVAYNTNLEQALQLINLTALDMSRDREWQHQILEPPQLMGIDSFGDIGLIVKLWIKTQPLQQWAVAREYRHRLKLAFDAAGITIPSLQQAPWLDHTP